MIRFLFFALLWAVCLKPVLADNFPLIVHDKGALLCYQGSEPVVKTAIQMLIEDSRLVCSAPFSVVSTVGERTIVIGIPEKEGAFNDLLTSNKIDFSDVTGKWEAFTIREAEIRGKNCLLVIGSDPRGAAYGVLEISRQIGVTPWSWWADVLPEKKTEVRFRPDHKVHAPSVQYRGIFLNDEDWALMPWSSRTFEPTSVKGQIGSRTYAKICELLLRLRANTLWPAMHECTVPFYFTPGAKEVAGQYGIVMGTSHCEPLMRTNTGEWDAEKYGPYNFLTNRENVLSYWEERLKEVSQTENIYTLGMRGVHDGRMQGVSSIEEEAGILKQVIKTQRELLEKNNLQKISEIPQVFIPYKEVLKAYDSGLELPDDVTLVWCDDNHGHLMRLSNPQEQKRAGGAGVYYHVSYWGKPHDYLWQAAVQPGLIYAEMKRAWDYGARKLWILNVGDIKPAEYLTEFFLDMAWDIDSFSGNTIYNHRENWVNTVFGGIAADSIQRILTQYYQLAGHRKPEHMGWSRVEDGSVKTRGGLTPVRDTEFSPFSFGDEIENRIRAYTEMEHLSAELYENRIPSSLKPAYFQLVHYPVAASAAMNRKLLYAQKARLYVPYGLPVAEEYARMATEAYHEIAALDYTYNKDMLRGKWDLMMDMKPRDLPVFQTPVLPSFEKEYADRENDLVVWVENSPGRPVQGKSIVLPPFSEGGGESYFIMLHTKGKYPIRWEWVEDSPAVGIKEVENELQYEKKLVVSLREGAPEKGSFRLRLNGEIYEFSYRTTGQAKNPTFFTESNRMIALNASGYMNPVSLETIQGLGHSGSSVRLPAAKKINAKAPHLEYKIVTTSSGPIRIKVGTLPMHPVQSKEMRYAIVIDKQSPLVVSAGAEFLTSKWAENVLRNQALTVSNALIDKPGEHTLRIYALDEEIVVDQLMIDFDLERKHYLIPVK